MSVIKSPKFIIGALVVVAIMIASRLWLPIVLPHITLAPEVLAVFGPLYFTNTMLTLLIAELLRLVLAFLATRRLQMVPSGLQNFFEGIVEFWETQSDQLVGPKLTKAWLPLVLTVFSLIWFSNYLHFLPGFDSIGLLCQPGHCPGETSEMTAAEKATEASALVKEEGKITHTLFKVQEGPAGLGIVTGKVPHGEGAEAVAHGEAGFAFIPLFRVPASDLNLAIALAVICFIAVEIAGFRTWGWKYLTKFFHFDFSHGIGTGVLNLFVGLIELISELARMLSWSFRLFGNIFAGSVLLVVFMFLIPLLLAVPVYGLELFVGLIQAYVFAILILAFMTLAVAPPHGDDH